MQLEMLTPFLGRTHLAHWLERWPGAARERPSEPLRAPPRERAFRA